MSNFVYRLTRLGLTSKRFHVSTTTVTSSRLNNFQYRGALAHQISCMNFTVPRLYLLTFFKP